MLCYLKNDNILEFVGICTQGEGDLGIVFPWAEGGSILDYMSQLEDKDKTFDHRNQWASTPLSYSVKATNCLCPFDCL